MKEYSSRGYDRYSGRPRNKRSRGNGPALQVFLILAVLALLGGNVALLLRMSGEGIIRLPIADQFGSTAPVPAAVSETEVPEEPPYVPQNYDLGEQVVYLGIKQKMTCSATDAVWSGFDSAVVSVSDAGEISGLTVGDTVLTASDSNGDTYNWTVRSRKLACLSFDDFPNENTQSILDTLDEKGVKATFFLCKLPKDSEFYPLYKEIADRGHTLGNHTSTHNRDRLFEKSENLLYGFKTMEQYLWDMGYKTKYIRLPYGSADPYALGVRKGTCHKLRELGYSIVDWSALTNDSYNSELKDQQRSLELTLDEDIEIILMHHKKSTAANLGALIDYIRSQGYELDSIDKSPVLFSQLYKWEENINQPGAGKYTQDMLIGEQYKQDE